MVPSVVKPKLPSTLKLCQAWSFKNGQIVLWPPRAEWMLGCCMLNSSEHLQSEYEPWGLHVYLVQAYAQYSTFAPFTWPNKLVSFGSRLMNEGLQNCPRSGLQRSSGPLRLHQRSFLCLWNHQGWGSTRVDQCQGFMSCPGLEGMTQWKQIATGLKKGIWFNVEAPVSFQIYEDLRPSAMVPWTSGLVSTVYSSLRLV